MTLTDQRLSRAVAAVAVGALVFFPLSAFLLENGRYAGGETASLLAGAFAAPSLLAWTLYPKAHSTVPATVRRASDRAFSRVASFLIFFGVGATAAYAVVTGYGVLQSHPLVATVVCGTLSGVVLTVLFWR